MTYTTNLSYDDDNRISSVSTGAVGSDYSYDDSQWPGLLTGYDGVTFSSDALGNLTGDWTWSYTWEHGRQLQDLLMLV